MRGRPLAVAVTGAIVGASAASAAAAVPGQVRASPSIRVIEHAAGTTGSAAVSLGNHGASTVTVATITHSCDSTIGLVPASGGTPFTIAPGAAHDVIVGCPTNLAPGLHRCTFTARDGAGDPLVRFVGGCQTDGVTVLSAEPAVHDFGTVSVGSTSQPFRFDITNTGGLDVGQLQLQLTDPDFVIGMPCNPDATGCDAAGIGPMARGATPITVACKPVTAGPVSAQLYVIGSNGFHLATPIDLTCTGAATTGPAISILPPVVDVGSVEQLGATAGASVVLSNAGGSTLGITSVQVVDAGTPGAAGDWSRTLTGKCTSVPCSLASGELLAIELTFDPSEIGQRGATLIVSYSDGAPKTATVPVHGIGRGATLELVGTAAAIDFGVVPPGVPSSLSISLRNTGNRNLADATAVATPAGPPFALPASPFAVTTTAQTTLSVKCQSAIPGMYATTVRISAPDVATPPIELAVRCEVRATPVFGDPTSLQLGEIRTASGVRHTSIRVLAAGAPVQLATAALAMANPNLTVTGPTPTTTTATLDLAIDPVVDGSLGNAIVVTPVDDAIDPIAIPIGGSIVTASYTAPAELRFGTFCVGQPTTSSIVTLTSTGTATIALAPPAMTRRPSPFDVAFASPTGYPAMLGAGAQARVEVTPKRRAAPGVIDDQLIWTADVAAAPTLSSVVHATFIDAGVAIAPTSLAFDPAPIHIDIDNAQQITLRNCDAATIHLGTPEVPAPFSMDSPQLEDFPTQLTPGDTTTFRVGFHPTKLGRYEEILEISSPELAAPLRVMLVGDGVTGDGGGGDDDATAPPDRSSFYACGGCGATTPSGAIAIALAGALAGRRRRRLLPR